MARTWKFPILLSVLGALLLASVVARTIPSIVGAGGWRTRFADAWPVFGAAFLLALVATILLRGAQATLRRRGRGRAARSLRPAEGFASGLALLVAIAAVTGNAGSALVSLGLVGFGLTLALQRPLLALAGWVAIHLGHLFREGDRIETMGIAGDVLEINLLTTRLWEIGTASSPLPSGGANTPQRPSGRIVTLSNATFLEQPLANATGDIRHVFDEFAVTVAYEADLDLARRLLHECGATVLDTRAHELAAEAYQRLTRGMEIEASFPQEPQVIEALQDSWIELRLRYLVDARSRAATRTKLTRAWLDATKRHADALPNVYPRVQPQQVGADGRPHR